MIDSDGFRPNVGIILANGKGQVLWAKRVGGHDGWQFPQGGIKKDESPEQALLREMEEEVGLVASDIEIVAVTKGWLRYRLPKRLVRAKPNTPVCVGQKQKWFLVRLIAPESHINVNFGDTPEFDGWVWSSYWHPIAKVVPFKRDVYRRALKELSAAHNLLMSIEASNLPVENIDESSEPEFCELTKFVSSKKGGGNA